MRDNLSIVLNLIFSSIIKCLKRISNIFNVFIQIIKTVKINFITE